MKKLITISVIFVVIAACDISERVEADYRNVIPLPHEIVMVDGNSFVVEKDTRILYPEDNGMHNSLPDTLKKQQEGG